jgi:hypothetical protein
MMVHKLEDAFLKAEKDSAKPFLQGRGKDSMDKYIEKVNSSKSGYHYPKLLAKMLYDAYEKDPALKNTIKGDAIYKAVCKIEQHRVDQKPVANVDSRSSKRNRLC